MTSSSVALLVGAVLACGACNSIAGLDGLSFGSGGAGGTTSQGGGTTSQGGGTTSQGGGTTSQGGGGTGGEATGPVIPADCGQVVFADGFEDGALDFAWSVDEPAWMDVGENQGTMVVAAGTGMAFAIGSYNYADDGGFTDRRASVEVVQPPSVADSQATLLLGQAGNFMSINVVGGSRLVVREGNMVGQTEQVDIPYSPTEHRYLRLRSDDGKLSAETSPDGADWAPQWDHPAPFLVDQAEIRIGLASFGVMDDEVRMDDFVLCE